MSTDIFIRTYVNDLDWLAYALKSIHKHVTGYRRIIIAIPQGQGHLLSHLTAETVIEVPDLEDGYLGQQLTKMQAWKYTDADAIVFWDSDVVATQPIHIQTEYFKDGKPILYKTMYTSLPGCPWQAVTEKAVGFVPEWEYMRRMPLVYLRKTLEDVEKFLVFQHQESLEWHIKSCPQRSFSEFNTIGALVDAHSPQDYTIIDTESIIMPPNKVEQFWSWGRINSEVEAKLKAILL